MQRSKVRTGVESQQRLGRQRGDLGRRVACGLVVALAAAPAVGDVFHYNNVIIGDRALGLAGAYTGVADDASGVVYNPAGLGFALSNDISGSANAFYSRIITYKKTLGDEPFKEEASGSIPSFFGGLQKLDQYVPGLVFAFGIYSIDSELKEQDDKYTNVLIPGVDADGNAVTTEVRRFHRAVNSRASTTTYAAAVARRFGANMAVGFGLGLKQIDELNLEFQDSVLAAGTAQLVTTQGVRTHLVASGIEPVIGVQFAFLGRFSLGMSAKTTVMLSDTYESKLDRSVFIVDGNGNLSCPGGAVSGCRSLADAEVENALGAMPTEVRLGFAWFANTRTLVTADVMHYTATSGETELFERQAVTNAALGVEYYVIPAVPVRFGFFTNQDARKEVDPAGTGGEHIDYMGGTLFLAWVTPNSQFAGGFVIQQGTGEAQKITGDSRIQEVEAMANTFAFSLTHSF